MSKNSPSSALSHDGGKAKETEDPCSAGFRVHCVPWNPYAKLHYQKPVSFISLQKKLKIKLKTQALGLRMGKYGLGGGEKTNL